jgi:hypothetical protein
MAEDLKAAREERRLEREELKREKVEWRTMFERLDRGDYYNDGPVNAADARSVFHGSDAPATRRFLKALESAICSWHRKRCIHPMVSETVQD